VYICICGIRATRNLYSVGKIYIASALLYCRGLCVLYTIVFFYVYSVFCFAIPQHQATVAAVLLAIGVLMCIGAV